MLEQPNEGAETGQKSDNEGAKPFEKKIKEKEVNNMGGYENSKAGRWNNESAVQSLQRAVC